MSRARHRAKGGKVVHWNAGEDQPAAKEAEEKKKGGRVDGEGHEGKKRHDRARARGGAVPGRKRGGGIGANLNPLSTAARVKHITKGETPEAGEHSD
jgi:hypothetical protein